MLALALVALCFVLVGVIIFQQHQGIVREDAWRLERTGLLQRIQAPERAVVEQGKRPERKPVPVIAIDDDAAFAELREKRNGAA